MNRLHLVDDMTRRLPVFLVLGAVLVWSTPAAGGEDAADAAPEVEQVAETTAEVVNAEPAEEEEPRYRLRYRFRAGDVVRYRTRDASTVEVEYSMSETTVEYETTSWKHYTVKKVHEDGSAELELRIDHVQMRAEGDGRTLEFDSRQPGAPPAEFAQFVESLGNPTRVQASPLGEVSLVEGANKKQAAAVASVLENLHLLIELPEEDVRIGDTWKDPFEVDVIVESSLKRKVRLQRTYRLMSVEEGLAQIDLQTIVLTPITDPAEEGQLIQRTPSGVITFDLEKGVIAAKATKLNNQVVGFSGPGSRIHVIRSVDESLTDSDGLGEVAAK